MIDDILHGLNAAQASAVTAPLAPTLVLAGPGSGKTRVLTRRIAYLLRTENLQAWNILAVTFTNKAAAEMKKRVQTMLAGSDEAHSVRIGTFHAICARLLRSDWEATPYKKDFLIYDTDDQASVVGQAMNDLNISEKQYPPRSVLYAISNAKNELILPSQYQAIDYTGEVIRRVYARYQQLLLANNALDFDDLLLQTAVLLNENDVIRAKYQSRFVTVLVDEFQDTNSAQYALVRLFGAPQEAVFAVGDEDQSIYAFRGANYRNVQRFRQDYPQAHVVLLEENYRSTQNILDTAQAVINKNTQRTPKALYTSKGKGARVVIQEAYDESREGEYIVEQILRARSQGYRYSDCAVMYRTNAQSRALEAAFRLQAVPYTLIGGLAFFQRREVKDLVAYLRAIYSPDDRLSFERIVNTPKRGIGERTMSQFFAWTIKANLSISEALVHLAQGGASPINAKSAKALAAFGRDLSRWREVAQPSQLLETLEDIIHNVNYADYLHEISQTEAQLKDRQENVNELRALLKMADESDVTLGELLADWSLMTDNDRVSDSDTVRLLTLHAAKGLEYPIVFIAGVEDHYLPHIRSKEDGDESIEEERRLFYVGITRAEERLYLTYTFKRASYAGYEVRRPSPFLFDIPQDLLDGVPPSLRLDGANGYRMATTWDAPSPSGGLDRLRADLAKQRTTPPPAVEARPSAPTPETYVPNPKFVGKIVPFPGGAVSKLKYKTGMMVMHPSFGRGRVIQSALRDGDELVTVAFEDKKHGIKSLMSSFANLQILTQ